MTISKARKVYHLSLANSDLVNFMLHIDKVTDRTGKLHSSNFLFCYPWLFLRRKRTCSSSFTLSSFSIKDSSSSNSCMSQLLSVIDPLYLLVTKFSSGPSNNPRSLHWPPLASVCLGLSMCSKVIEVFCFLI